jgi:transcription antitermination factor NusG
MAHRFLPGEKVRIIGGTFEGYSAEVLGPDAHAPLLEGADDATAVPVVVNIFGRATQLRLFPELLVPDDWPA